MPNARLPGLPNPHSYDTQTDGVVTDRVTGLMWQRNLANKFLTQPEAEQACDQLTLAGHADCLSDESLLGRATGAACKMQPDVLLRGRQKIALS